MRTNGEGTPVVAIDLDGTLGDFHAHFLEFAALWIGKPMPPADEINPGLRLHRFMGVSLSTYRECKLAFRQGGIKRWMPMYPGADVFIRNLRRLGAEVWICTTRPYLRLDNIDPDTREWLRRNKIEYDAILFGDRKYPELRRQAGPRVAAVIDDLPEQWAAAVQALPRAEVYLRDQPYNRQVPSAPMRIYNFKEPARVSVFGAVKRWRERNA